jgi:hypothetical protein
VDIASQRGRFIVSDIAGVAVSELAISSFPPAADRSGIEQRAGMGSADSELDNRTSNIDVAGRGRRLIVADIADVGVSELAIRCISPAADRAGIEQGTGMSSADSKPGDRAANIDIADRSWHFIIADVVEVAISELAIRCIAPAMDRASTEEGTGVRAAGGELDDRAVNMDVTSRNWGLIVSDITGVAVSELAISSFPPTVDCTCAE